MIKARLIQDSVNSHLGTRITTIQGDYPRFIHAEVMTHRMFTRNGQSSRAIPSVSAIELAKDKMVFPMSWKRNQSGMQPGERMSATDRDLAREIWKDAAYSCIDACEQLRELKLHKQWANRMLEWFSPIRVLITATEWDNFLWLRNHSDAQEEIEFFANEIQNILNLSRPLALSTGELHVPFVTRTKNKGILGYVASDGQNLSKQEALRVSSSCSAQISYRKNDDTLSKANNLHSRFIDSDRVHASPFEHQAEPYGRKAVCLDEGWPDSATHVDRQHNFWSGNFKNWGQYRQTIPNHVYNGEDNAVCP